MEVGPEMLAAVGVALCLVLILVLVAYYVKSKSSKKILPD